MRNVDVPDTKYRNDTFGNRAGITRPYLNFEQPSCLPVITVSTASAPSGFVDGFVYTKLAAFKFMVICT